ncbi:DUF177 domain-containing protein [bacterium]|nr:DUF177 domain-containing protein [bacterium]
MLKVKVEDIELEGSLSVKFKDKITELDGCNIEADVKFKNMGEFIQALGHIKGKIVLECDRCLNKFDYDLDIDIDETYAKKSLYEDYSQELELSSGQFITDLNGEDEIDVYDLLYQSVILALPNKRVCGINCNEGLFVSDEDMEVHDERMDVFKNIQIKGKG